MMARNHWQIIKHGKDGSFSEGQFKTVPIAKAPKEAVEIAVRAARAIGDGFYGVDLKETGEGIFVMEVNDNPNLDHGVEDQGSKDEVWVRLLDWFAERMV
jgi:glutathione synthase/RimK-type ligase-like ATP-grasp enzyme